MFENFPWSFGPLERALIKTLQRTYPQAQPAVLVAAALCSEALAQGDVCISLDRLMYRLRDWPDAPVDKATWRDLLQASELVVSDLHRYAPLSFEFDRLYLSRYQAYEAELAQRLLALSENRPAVDEAQLSASLQRLFAGNQQSPDWQRIAAAQAVRHRLCVISGGPGTGKTTTVVRLLAALLEQPGNERLAIGLAAPTGKAAARMAESIRQAKAKLPVTDAVKQALPEEASTLHRLLGSRGTDPRVRHTAENPLPLDVLVVDEASMVDLAMMAKLLVALPSIARLILLGDKDQLCAVEAGAVFAELCQGRGLSTGEAALLSELLQQPVPAVAGYSQLGESITLLTHSHRFSSESGIGQLAAAVNQGDSQAASSLLGCYPDELEWQSEPNAQALQQRLYDGYKPYLTAARSGDPQQAFAQFSRFRALTALREGPFGVVGLNEALEPRFRQLQNASASERWYVGRAVMVLHNDYTLGLFNGDIGLCLPHAEDGMRVYFESDDGFRHFSPARLPVHETAFAMTVHKSQGSEFADVVLALSEQPSPLLSRSLLYTGITRAKERVEIWALPDRLVEAIKSATPRASGLALRLA